jgi:hypothetical protein
MDEFPEGEIRRPNFRRVAAPGGLTTISGRQK